MDNLFEMQSNKSKNENVVAEKSLITKAIYCFASENIQLIQVFFRWMKLVVVVVLLFCILSYVLAHF